MTKLLASVMSVEEARIAFECGADIIDCKDPSSGALGALRDETIAAIVSYVAGRRPVSATIGDLPMEPRLIRDAVKAKMKTGVDYIKVGIFPPQGSGRNSHLSLRANAKQSRIAETLATFASLNSKTSLIAVLFADQRPKLTLLPLVANAGFAGVMLDTANKSGGGLMSHISCALLARFVSIARESGLISGFAGSLRIEDIPCLLAFSPDYLGFRGALCKTARASAVERDKVTEVATAMSRNPTHGLTDSIIA